MGTGFVKTYLYVTPFFPTPTSWRGAYSYDFVRALQRVLEVKGSTTGEKYRIVVLKEGDGTDYEIGGVKVHTFRARRLPSNVFPNLFARQNERSFLAVVRQLGVRFDDIVVCHANVANYGIYPLAIKRKNPHVKAILQHHDLQSFGLNMGLLRHCWLYNMIQFLVMRRVHEKLDAHIFISEACRRSFLLAPDTSWTAYEDYKKQMRGLPWRPARIKHGIVLYNGVDIGVFSPRRQNWSVGNEFVIGCVGNFQELKGQATLVRAVGIVCHEVQVAKVLGNRAVRVVFIGSGETLEACKTLARKQYAGCLTHLTYEFRTEMRHEDLAAFYKGLDLFVLPSWFEGFGCVCAEAHSCGVPFITCEGQGLEDLICPNERKKWLCRQRDPDDLAKKIEDFICRQSCCGVTEEQKLRVSLNIDCLTEVFVRELSALAPIGL